MNEKLFSGSFECATHIMVCKHNSEFYEGCKVGGLKDKAQFPFQSTLQP